MSDQLTQRIGEAIWTALEGQAHMGYVSHEDCVIDIGMADNLDMNAVAEAVVAALPKTRRQYVAAYRAENGTVIGIGEISGWREGAERDAQALRSPEDETPVFVAYRDLPEWTRWAGVPGDESQ